MMILSTYRIGLTYLILFTNMCSYIDTSWRLNKSEQKCMPAHYLSVCGVSMNGEMRPTFTCRIWNFCIIL
uniref:Uncharacterized protein n=1 Tax=Rhizophora mucronata TaxID=61149 RepID=A0A2P2M682_RHIMU